MNKVTAIGTKLNVLAVSRAIANNHRSITVTTVNVTMLSNVHQITATTVNQPIAIKVGVKISKSLAPGVNLLEAIRPRMVAV
jgi:putative Mn2+ efflux pump MntP